MPALLTEQKELLFQNLLPGEDAPLAGTTRGRRLYWHKPVAPARDKCWQRRIHLACSASGGKKRRQEHCGGRVPAEGKAEYHTQQ